MHFPLLFYQQTIFVIHGRHYPQMYFGPLLSYNAETCPLWTNVVNWQVMDGIRNHLPVADQRPLTSSILAFVALYDAPTKLNKRHFLSNLNAFYAICYTFDAVQMHLIVTDGSPTLTSLLFYVIVRESSDCHQAGHTIRTNDHWTSD